ncbi:MAG: DinB family protein [Gemmatimonadales bacterium]
MFTVEGLRDLFRHLEWAESRVWNAALGSEEAIADAELLQRFHHIHMTQRAFLDVWAGQAVGRYQDLSFSSLREVYHWARPYYGEAGAWLARLTPERLDSPMPVPWARYFAKATGGMVGSTTLGETLFQVTAHSAYHRGQVNTRLRALGVAPPLVDYIGWLWLGRPHPGWPGDG